MPDAGAREARLRGERCVWYFGRLDNGTGDRARGTRPSASGPLSWTVNRASRTGSSLVERASLPEGNEADILSRVCALGGPDAC